MDPKDKVIIVTGGASGIGRSIARRFAQEGALAVADEIGGLAVRCDVAREADIQALVAATRERYGRVDAYISNAGILGRPGGIELEDPLWDAMWNIHGMAHVWAARAVVPEMVERGEGFFLVTASAAGLLTIVESAPYAVTKHAQAQTGG
jgi:NAD(P)-dependent dehydrogenase (short-subunit alcohol dehydrogenase family)